MIQSRLISFTVGGRVVVEEWFNHSTPWETISEWFESQYQYDPAEESHDLHIRGTQ